MKKLTLKRIFHRGNKKLAMIFSFDPILTQIAKGIRNVQFSNTHKCWYADDTEESLREILKAFRDTAEIDIFEISSCYRPPSPDAEETSSEKTREEVTFDNGDDETPSQEAGHHIAGGSRFDPVEIRINEERGRLIIRFTGHYDRQWIDELKTYGKVYYDREHKEFLLPWSKLTVDSLSDYFAGLSVAVRVIRPKVDKVIIEKRKTFSDDVRSRNLTDDGFEAVETLRQHLQQSRYSGRTIDSYLTLLELFFKYFITKSPEEISREDVSDFMNDFIIKNGFSSSYQNQMISAIKLYYEISGKGKIIPQFLERPRRGRSLPKVFSKEEVTRILNSLRNSKHKLLLWMIYSCGLRRSEVTNIKLTDIDRKRNLIHIREGKGRVDRIVPVPEKLWAKLDAYIGSYRPREYLFEGPSGKRYSVESVYSVFRQALSKAGIQKEVGVHSLRHSYATHLHENGLDIRYIQELLGHKSTRTTEIYTHVSRRNLVTVRSPLEDLDLK